MKFFRTAGVLCAQFHNYRSIRDLPVIASLWYLTRLVFLLTSLTLLALVPNGLQRVDALGQWADQNLPAFSLNEGRVTTSVPQPYRLDTEYARFILDTTGATSQPDTNAAQGVLINADSFLFWIISTNGPTPVTHMQHSNLRGFPDGVVNGAYLRQLFRSFLWIGLPFAGLMLTGIALFVILIHAGLFALLASRFERNASPPLTLQQLLNIAIHAATPALLVNAAYLVLQLKGVNLWWLYLIVYGLYLLGATAACHEASPRESANSDNLI